MRLSKSLVVTWAIGLIAPLVAHAQVANQTDIVGKWVHAYNWTDSLKKKENHVEAYLTVNPDSTWTIDTKVNDTTYENSGKGRGIPLGAVSAEIQNQQLFLWNKYSKDGKSSQECASVYSRFDPSKPLPAPTSPQVCK